jgi:hypothetical protein
MPDDEPLFEPSDDTTPIKREVTTHMVPVTALQAARGKATKLQNELAAARAELEEAKAQAAALTPEAERWRQHAATEAERIKAETATALAALPEAVRAGLAGLDPVAQAAAIKAIQAMPATQVAKEHPVGGGVQQGAAGSVELTAAEAAWVATERPDLRGVSPAVVKKQYAKHRGAASPA